MDMSRKDAGRKRKLHGFVARPGQSGDDDDDDSGAVVQREVKRPKTGRRDADTVVRPGGENLVKTHGPAATRPPSLFDACVDFVARNAQHLDSLVDFPSDVARKIWARCSDVGKFDDASCAPAVLETFCSAFPDEILPSAKIAHDNGLLVINNYEGRLKALFGHVKALDLTGCQLGEGHDLLVHLAGSCRRLEILVLANNRLSGASLRLLFGVPDAPGRLKNDRFPRLERLDLSGNPKVSANALKRYVLQLERLEVLIVGAPKNLVKSLRDNLGPRFVLQKDDDDGGSVRVENTGWASSIVDDWITKEVEKLARKNAERDKSSTSKFYNTKRSCVRIPDSRHDETMSVAKFVRNYSQTGLDKSASRNVSSSPSFNDDVAFDRSIFAMYK